MDSYSYSYSSGGEKLNIKSRKPYTITKQRERWTEDEHNSFLEALKLYGRAWQRIEEHIGTKTAVQIRSHAQKFFTKLEKEALAKGIPTKQALDIEIPPPRPKRKPNYPYPRKTDPQDGKHQPTLVSSLQLLDLETKPLSETSSHQEKLEETSDHVEVPSQENENQGVCMPSLEEMNNHYESYITTIETRNDKSNPSQQPGAHNNYPRHVPVQVVDAKNSVPTFHESSSSLNKSGVVDKNPLLSSSSSNYQQIVANIHPLLNPFCCDNQSSFLQVPSSISSLIVSSLVQNPAAHAAASFAATFWHPPQNAEASSRDHVNPPPPPSMAAIAGATVAAATAWWAAHGLLPVCTTPFYNPASTSNCPFSFGHGNQTRVDDTSNERDKASNERDKAPSEHLSSSSEEEEEVEESDGKLNTPEEMVPPVVVVETTTTTIVRKQVDRSSCGSNTTSSSEIETNALDKHVKEKEETKGSDDVNDSSSRGRISRSSIISPNESWKEVSEEGRLAFQALFSREVLPQSFSDTRRRDILVNNNQLDLNQEAAAGAGESNGFAHLQQAVGLPSVKLNFHHTGFKPYKRCSIDAKETTKTTASSSSTGNQNGDLKAPKRMRLETST